VQALAARGHDVVVFARTASRSRLPGAAVDGDIRDRAALERAAAGCDAVSHSAALVSIWRRRRQDFDDVNVGGLRNVLAVAATHRLSRVLYTSSFVALPRAAGPRRWRRTITSERKWPPIVWPAKRSATAVLWFASTRVSCMDRAR